MPARCGPTKRQVGGVLHVGLLADWLGTAAAVQLMAARGPLAPALAALLWPELRPPTTSHRLPRKTD